MQRPQWRITPSAVMVISLILLYGLVLLNHGTQVECSKPIIKPNQILQTVDLNKICPRRDANVAIVMPFQSKRIKHVLSHVGRWNESWCLPCTPDETDPKTEMIFLHDWDLTEIDSKKEVEDPIMQVINNSPQIKKCFKSIKFMSSETQSDVPIMRQITDQFYATFELLISENIDYFFLMEADTIPIRPNWARQVYLESACGSDFWVKGSVHRNALRIGVKEFGFHINGNALYKTCKNDFQCAEYFGNAHDVTYGAPYDFILWRESHIKTNNRSLDSLHRYRYSDFVQNQYHNMLWKVERIVNSSPNTYFVHGKRFVTPSGVVINMKEKKPAAPEPSKPQEDAGKDFGRAPEEKEGQKGKRNDDGY